MTIKERGDSIYAKSEQLKGLIDTGLCRDLTRSNYHENQKWGETRNEGVWHGIREHALLGREYIRIQDRNEYTV